MFYSLLFFLVSCLCLPDICFCYSESERFKYAGVKNHIWEIKASILEWHQVAKSLAAHLTLRTSIHSHSIGNIHTLHLCGSAWGDPERDHGKQSL